METLVSAFNEFAGLRWNDAIVNDPTVEERESEANVLCMRLAMLVKDDPRAFALVEEIQEAYGALGGSMADAAYTRGFHDGLRMDKATR